MSKEDEGTFWGSWERQLACREAKQLEKTLRSRLSFPKTVRESTQTTSWTWMTLCLWKGSLAWMWLVKSIYTGSAYWDDDSLTACVCTCVMVGYFIGVFVRQWDNIGVLFQCLSWSLVFSNSSPGECTDSCFIGGSNWNPSSLGWIAIEFLQSCYRVHESLMTLMMLWL